MLSDCADWYRVLQKETAIVFGSNFFQTCRLVLRFGEQQTDHSPSILSTLTPKTTDSVLSTARSPGRWSSAWDENRYEKRAEEFWAPQKRSRIVCVIFLYIPHHILKNKKTLKKIRLFFLVDQIGAKIDLVTQKGDPMILEDFQCKSTIDLH